MKSKKMGQWVDEALDAGAFGLSTGLEYPPFITGSSTEEIIALAKLVGRRGGMYATHARHRVFNADKGVQEAIRIAEESGTRLQVSHITPRVFARHQTEKVLSLCREARSRGVEVGFDIYPYEWAPGPMYELLPGWALEGSNDEIIKRFKEPQFRARVIREHRKNLVRWVQLDRWDKIVVAIAPNMPEVAGKSISDIAAERNLSPWDVVFDILAEAGDEFPAIMEIAHSIDWEDILLTASDESCSFGSDSVTLSAQGPLKDVTFTPGSYGFVPRVFDEFVANRNVFTFEEAVRRLTSLPASQLGIWDRGIIRPNMAADLTLVNPETLHDNATWTNFNARPGGIDYVIINGRVVVKDGHATNTRSGKILKP